MTPRCRSRTNPSTVMCYPPSRNAFGARMFHRLRSDRPIRRRRGRRCSYGRGQIRNPVSIRERPAEADTRAGLRSRNPSAERDPSLPGLLDYQRSGAATVWWSQPQRYGPPWT